jgi:hypothetical protein
MTPEDKIKKLEHKIEKIRGILHSRNHELVETHTELRLTKHMYNDLYRSCLYIGKNYAIPVHLERVIDMQARVIEKYQEHYAKWGHFYSEWEKKEKELEKKLSTE